MALRQTLRMLFRFPSSSDAVRTAATSVRHAPATVITGSASHPNARRLTLQDQFRKLCIAVDAATTQSQAVQRTHAVARERLDATELSLRRMLGEIEGLMAVGPMRSLEPSAASRARARGHVALAA